MWKSDSLGTPTLLFWPRGRRQSSVKLEGQCKSYGKLLFTSEKGSLGLAGIKHVSKTTHGIWRRMVDSSTTLSGVKG